MTSQCALQSNLAPVLPAPCRVSQSWSTLTGPEGRVPLLLSHSRWEEGRAPRGRPSTEHSRGPGRDLPLMPTALPSPGQMEVRLRRLPLPPGRLEEESGMRHKLQGVSESFKLLRKKSPSLGQAQRAPIKVTISGKRTTL